MKQELFRKESLKRVESPDELDKYVRVTTPGVWILLAALVVILLGGCVWGFFGRLNTVVKGACISEQGIQHCIVAESDGDKIKEGMQVKVADCFGTVTEEGFLPVLYGDVAARYNYPIDKSEYNIKVLEFTSKTNIPDGMYYMEIIIESKSPFSFVFN